MCFFMVLFMLRHFMIFDNSMHNGTLVGARCDYMYKESVLPRCRTYHLRTRRTFARERASVRRTSSAALLAAHSPRTHRDHYATICLDHKHRPLRWGLDLC